MSTAELVDVAFGTNSAQDFVLDVDLDLVDMDESCCSTYNKAQYC